MRLAYVVFGPVARSPQGFTSPFASIRYRVLGPAAELARLGAKLEIVTVDGAIDRATVGRALDKDVVVFSCSLGEVTERLMDVAESLGARTVVDVCDNFFVNSPLAGHYRTICARADLVVATTAAMAEAVWEHSGRRADVVGDPVEGPRGTPVSPVAADGGVDMLWFGGRTNLDTLPALRRALPAGRPVRLTLVTADEPPARAFLDQARRDGISARLVPWTPEALWQALAECSVVVLPSDPGDPQKRVKSPNRLTEALWAGRCVVADPLPSYEDFGDFAYVASDLAAALSQALGQPAHARDKIARGQSHLAARHATGAVAKLWVRALERLMARGLAR